MRRFHILLCATLAAVVACAVTREPKQVDFFAFTAVVQLDDDGTICLPLFKPPLTPGARVVLVAPVRPYSVAYGIVQSPQLPSCGAYGNLSYRVAIKDGSIPEHMPVIAMLDETMRVTVKKGLLVGKRSTGQRCYFHVCTGEDGPFFSISLDQPHGTPCWYEHHDIPATISLPQCTEKESAHYGE